MEILNGLKYSFYILVHPFDGFWCAKSEKRGNAKSATIIIGLVILVYILSRQMTGFIFNFNDPKEINIISEILSVIIPVALWCFSNWGITTLMDGEGTLKDVYIACAYALVPLVIINIPMIVLSNVVALEEAEIYYVLNTFSVLWVGFLLVVGTMTIHQYTLKKTVLTIIIAVVGMALMLFLALLFFALIQQLINFLYIFYKEFMLRLM